MPITFGSVGDIIAVCVLVKDCVDALSDTNGSAPQYQAVVRELHILEKALLEVGVLSRTHATTPELIALFTSADTTIEQCRKALEAFKAKTKPYDQHLGATSTNIAVQKLCKGNARKILWQVLMKDEVARFRAEVVAFSVSIDQILAAATMHTVKAQADRIDSRVEDLQRDNQRSFDHQDDMLKEIHTRLHEVDQRISAGNSLIIRLATNARKTWLLKLGNELKALMLNTVAINLAIYASVDKVHESVMDIRRILPNLTPIVPVLQERKFYLVDAIGRQSTITLDWIDSYDALTAVLEVRFKGKTGEKKILKKEYAIQNRATGRDMDISIPWESFFLPGLCFYMSMIFQIVQDEETHDPEQDSCPRCSAKSNQPQGLKIICSVCGQEYQYDRSSDLTTADTSSAPIPAYTHAPDAPDSHVNAPRVEDKITQCPEPFTGPSEPISESDPDDDPANFNHVRIKTKTVRSQVTGGEDTAPPTDPVESDSDLGPVSHLAEDEWVYYSPRHDAAPEYVSTYRSLYQSYVREDSRSVTSSRDRRRRPSYHYEYPPKSDAGQSYDHVFDHGYGYDYDWSGSPRRARRASRLQKIAKYEEAEIVNASKTPTANATTHGQPKADDTDDEAGVVSEQAKGLEKNVKATEEDARRAGIPAGYSYRNWDPNEEPIMLLGSVFDANSLGKWIFDWTVFYNGPATPLSELAGEFWLLLIQLAGKIKRAEETMPKIRKKESHEMIEDFLESGERLWIRFAKLLKTCEDYMWKRAKRDAGGAKVKQLGMNSGLEFVNSIFGKDRELEKTEKLMTGMRLWSMRFDNNCDEILRHPSA